MEPGVIAVIGTTGVGKSNLSIQLAKELDGEVINADALQVYQGLDIITNKMPLDEREGIKHHLMDFLPMDQEYSVLDFKADALDLIKQIHDRKHIPVVVGGTHYYIQSLLWRDTLLDTKKNAGTFSKTEQQEQNKASEKFLQESDTPTLYKKLQEVDPIMANKWHENDRRKITRSLQVFFETGQSQRCHRVYSGSILRRMFSTPVLTPEVDYLTRSKECEQAWGRIQIMSAVFGKPLLKKFLKTEDFQKQKVFPPKEDIYSWSRFTPLPTVRVVILGQDPYHGDNQAHGLCFSVKKPVRPPPSLLNMFKLLEKDIPGFKIPNHGYLESWARQGVLMVNAAMTVRAHQANSHKGKGWEKFLDAVIKTVSDQRRNVVFLMWGKDAQNRGTLVDKKKHLVLQSVHPSPLSAHRGFFDCAHFSKANKYLEEHGQDPINWNSLVDDTS
ncbi:hypothetical protein EDD11_008693 [Mortierella claussenii]|nr:hypothetical protein EDD11_008693 [Mortierella claussenii]